MTRQSRSVCLFLAMFFAVLILAAPGAFAQTAQGRISGQVTDSTGAAVPNAAINIENIATHVSRTLQTNSTGDYSAPSIDPGVYSITVEAPGFTKLVRERVQIEVGNDLKIDFRLKIGSINETIEVKDEAPLTEASNAVLNGVLSNKAINELPAPGPRLPEFAAASPRRATRSRRRLPHAHLERQSPRRQQLHHRRRERQRRLLWRNRHERRRHLRHARQHAAARCHPGIQHHRAARRRVRRKPGVVVNIGIKSGTNDMHGTAYYFHRNSAFDARNYFNPSPEPISALLLHQFGASIGGPIKKNKWFYFANYEGVRDKVGNPFDVFTPATSSLIGNPLTASSGIDPTEYSIPDAEAAAGCPAACNPLSLKLLSLFPRIPASQPIPTIPPRSITTSTT